MHTKTLRRVGPGWVSLLMALGLAISTRAQEPAPVSDGSDQASRYYELVQPVALYPDSLLGDVLTAATFPDQIAAAGTNRQSAEEPDASWNPSVQSVWYLPDVVEMMAESLDWTRELGAAYESNPDEVLGAIQQFRYVVQEAGNLESTPQMSVSGGDGDTIIIQSADPEVVYVPTHSTSAVVVESSTPVLGFAAGVATAGLVHCARCEWAQNYHGYHHPAPYNPYHRPPEGSPRSGDFQAQRDASRNVNRDVSLT